MGDEESSSKKTWGNEYLRLRRDDQIPRRPHAGTFGNFFFTGPSRRKILFEKDGKTWPMITSREKLSSHFAQMGALATNIGDTFFYENGKESRGSGRSQGCTGSMSRSLLLAHGQIDLSRCMGPGNWIFAGHSPTCFFTERSFEVLFPSAPGDAAPRPLAPPAPPIQDPLSPCVSLFLCHPCLP